MSPQSTTTAASETPLFPASLLPPDAQPPPAGGEAYTVRPLRRSDYARGYLDCLAGLTWVGDEPAGDGDGDGDGEPQQQQHLTEADFLERYDEIDTGGKGPYYLLVVEHAGRIVATGTLIAEKKFIHNRGTAGHIEEIAVLPSHQGRGLGLAVMRALDLLARRVGCYKTILDCGPRTEAFYAKCGFANSGIEMSRYLDDVGEARGGYYRG